MISSSDRDAIVNLAKKYGVTRVLLFGSATNKEHDSRDIDLAVEGVEPSRFFKFYGELILSLSKPVDLIDLATRSKFTDLVNEEGVLLYG